MPLACSGQECLVGAGAGEDWFMALMKERLRGDLTAAMKARDEISVRTLRVAGRADGARDLAGVRRRLGTIPPG